MDETKSGMNDKLELWRRTLETRGFRLSRNKTEYVACRFSGGEEEDQTVVKLDGSTIPVSKYFRYLGSVIQDDAEIKKDVDHRIQTGWLRWRAATGVLCDRNVPAKLKGKFYRTVVRPALLYGAECWAISKKHEQSLGVAEMRMLRWMCGKTRKDRVRNEDIRSQVGVAPIEGKMREHRLRWFGHICRRPSDAPVRRTEHMRLCFKRKRGRPRKTWKEVIKKDMQHMGLTEDNSFKPY